MYEMGSMSKEDAQSVLIAKLTSQFSVVYECLRRLLREADDHNARCGKPDRLCMYCATTYYDALEGLVHPDSCIIRKSREAIRDSRELLDWIALTT